MVSGRKGKRRTNEKKIPTNTPPHTVGTHRSWEIYRCGIDCADHPNDCISETLYKQQADAYVPKSYFHSGCLRALCMRSARRQCAPLLLSPCQLPLWLYRCNRVLTPTPPLWGFSSPTQTTISAIKKYRTNSMVAQGFNTVGYDSIHMDDCWEEKVPARDPVTNKLRGDSKRFPSGMKVRKKNLIPSHFRPGSMSTPSLSPAVSKW